MQNIFKMADSKNKVELLYKISKDTKSAEAEYSFDRD